MHKAAQRLRSEISWGTRVTQRREALGFSQEQLGKLAGRDRSLISRIEANLVTPRFDTMNLIARAMGTTVDDLFPWEAHPGRKQAS